MATIDQTVIDEMVSRAPLNFAICGEIAEKFGLKQRAVVASAVRQKIAYENKKRVSKSGAAVVSKADLVVAISDNLEIPVADLDGLEKSTKTALEAIAQRTFDILEIPEAEETGTETDD